MPVCITNIARASEEDVTELSQYGVATIHEAQGRTGLLSPALRPIYAGAQAAGTAVTVHLRPGDNWMIHVAVEQCRPGDILVAAPTSPCSDGYFGDLLATSLMARGVRGLVIEGGVRDVADLTRMGFPVWSTHISAAGTVKEQLGDVNLPLAIGGQVVNPGDVVVADDDGVVVVPRDHTRRAISGAEAREAREAQVRERYARGELGIDINEMRPKLEAKGFTWRAQDAED